MWLGSTQPTDKQHYVERLVDNARFRRHRARKAVTKLFLALYTILTKTAEATMRKSAVEASALVSTMLHALIRMLRSVERVQVAHTLAGLDLVFTGAELASVLSLLPQDLAAAAAATVTDGPYTPVQEMPPWLPQLSAAVVIVGAPGAGKSELLEYLTGRTRHATGRHGETWAEAATDTHWLTLTSVDANQRTLRNLATAADDGVDGLILVADGRQVRGDREADSFAAELHGASTRGRTHSLPTALSRPNPATCAGHVG